MADAKISALADIVTLAAGDKVPVADLSDLTASKSATMTELVTYLQTLGMPRVRRLNSQHSNSTTTATIISDLSITLEAGTYMFDFQLFVRAGAITTSPMFALNFTGTLTTKNWWFEYADASATLLAAIGTIDDVGVTTVGFGMRSAQNVLATTTANMGNTGSANAMATITTDHLVKISGLIIVTVSGSLNLYHGSETATATTTEVGSSLSVIRTA